VAFSLVHYVEDEGLVVSLLSCDFEGFYAFLLEVRGTVEIGDEEDSSHLKQQFC
jgi:hypothetical protein